MASAIPGGGDSGDSTSMIPFDSSEISNWADKPDSQHQLPELIRRLILATVPMPSLLAMPSGSFSMAVWVGRPARHHGRKRLGSIRRFGLGVQHQQENWDQGYGRLREAAGKPHDDVRVRHSSCVERQG